MKKLAASMAKSIGSKAFSGCTGLTKAAFTNKQYSSWTANTTGGQSENLSILDDTANATYLKTTYLGEWTRNN